MALYHFTVKTDKKPSGMKVKAVEHARYIDREGKYKDLDDAKTFSENFIHGLLKKNVLDGDEAMLLYESPYGNIMTNRKGLQITNNPSPETLAVALMISKRALGDTVVVEGSEKFKKRCVDAAAMAELDLKFADEKMQESFDEKRKELQDERDRFVQSGGQLRRRNRIPEPDPFESGAETLQALAERQFAGLPTLSERGLDAARSEDASMLVPDHAGDELDNEGASGTPPVRWDVCWGRRGAAVKTAKGILKNLLKHQKEFVAMSHAKYIDREGAFEKKGGCVYQQCRVPSWAKDVDGNPSATVFFAAADRYSPENAERYREIEFALPNELTLEQNKELIQNFIDRVLPDHYYALAIHDKIGSLSDGTRNVHCHLMFSPRLIDDVEKTKERKKSVYFQRALQKNAKDQSEDAKRSHGAPVDLRWHDRLFIREVRAEFADIQNEMLEKTGHGERVDHRSLKAQREEALLMGDTFLAKLLDRLPEQHIRSIALLEEGNSETRAIKNFRNQKKIYIDLLYATAMAEQAQKEMQIRDKEVGVVEKAKELQETSAFGEAGNEEDGSLLHDLKMDFIDALNEVEEAKKHVIFASDARKMAMEEKMTPKELETWEAYQHVQEESQKWSAFLREYKLPKKATPQEVQDDKEMRQRVGKLLENLKVEGTKLKSQVDDITHRLVGNKDLNSRIKIRTQRILHQTKSEMQKYQKANEHLEKAMEALQEVLFDDAMREEKQESFSAKELYSIMRAKYYGWRKELKKLEARREEAAKKVISPKRALEMAVDVYTKKATVELRKVQREIGKREEYLANDEKAFSEAQEHFASLPVPNVWNPMEVNAYNLEKQKVIKAKEKLQGTRDKLAELHTQETSLQAQIQRLMKAPNAAEHIQDIADGILRKNMPQRKAYENICKKIEIVRGKVAHAKTQMDAMKRLAKVDSPKARYKDLRPEKRKSGGGGGGRSGSSPMDYPTPSMIADAILGDPKAVKLAGRIDENKNIIGLDDWKFKSELTKAEEEYDEFLRE